MKSINVVAAIIINEDKVLATQRADGDFKGGWEFPGGKIELGECSEDALKREIKEELNLEIQVDYYLETVKHDYPKFRLSMDCFVCSLVSGDLQLVDHMAARWLDKNNLDTVEWLPADVGIVEKLKSSIL
jgi:8-oxo-dGTP diphosphatase